MQTMTAGKVKGIDVSHHNGTINWTKVKTAGYQFAYIKATESTNFIDSNFQTNVKNAKAVGLKTGAYHFARPNGSASDGTAEAQYFLSQITKVDLDLLPCLDLEASNLNAAQTASWVDAFAAEIKRQIGKRILLYTGLWFMNQLGGGLSSKLAKYPLWVSHYKTSAPPNNGWTNWTVWQYSDKGTVPGITGGVDVNVAVSLDAILATKELEFAIPATWDGKTYLRKLGFTEPLVQGEDVKVVQRIIGITADGVYGSATNVAVQKWKAVNGLNAANGAIDKIVWDALIASTTKSADSPMYDLGADGKGIISSKHWEEIEPKLKALFDKGTDKITLDKAKR